ncbi:MAG: hypothetical protein ABSH22_21705, partial [Tepidisphaeraceae bacterium]
MTQLPNRADSSRRSSLLARLAFAAVFLAILVGTSVWLIRKYALQPETVIVPLPQITQVTPAKPGQPVQAAPPVAAAPRPRPAGALNFITPTFTGSVVDAQTHQPVAAFVAMIGFKVAANPSVINYNSDPNSPARFVGGQYSITPFQGLTPNVDWFVRVEAKGYSPAVSDAQHDSATLNFELTPSKDITGHVYGLDGKPASGISMATVISGASNVIVEDNGKLVVQGGTAFTSAADGSYALPPQTGEYLVVACSPQGYAQLDQDEIAKSTDIHLLPFGTIEGRVLIGKQALSDTSIQISSVNGVRTHPMVNTMVFADIDPDGHFSIPQIRPGPVQLSRAVTTGHNRALTLTKIVTAEAGKTVSVDLGAGGREVTGKLIIPSGVSVSGNTYLIGTAIPVLPPIDAMPPAIKASNPERQQQWMRQFAMTPQGAEFLKAHPEFAPPIQPYWVESSDSKTFRLEGVEPGDYYLQVYVQVPYRQGSVRLAGAEVNFTMPAITPDVADQPLTVGDVSMRLITPMPRDAAPQNAAGLTTAGQTTFIGKVIDAQTHQPVDGIVPLLGRASDAGQPLGYVANMGQAININPMLASQVRLKPFDGGQYTLSLPANYPANYSWFVRVEARGYLPALSSAQHGSATVDFALTPAKDIVGHVYGIDGKPEAGVALGVAIPGLPSLGLRDGALVGFAAAAATSAADGAYDLPPQSGEFTIVACGPDGITKANQDDIAKSPDIHLLPWGGIEGRAIVGDKPMVGSDIIASSPNYNAPTSLDYSSLRFSATVQADENGNFSFAKLPPGEVQIYRHFSQILGPQYPQIHLAGNAQTIRETIE